MIKCKLNTLHRRICFKKISTHSSQKSCNHINNEKAILVEKLGEITVIGLNRPDKRNCIDLSMAKELKEALENFEADDSSCAGVIHGMGGNFCAGIDLTHMTTLDTNNYDKKKILPLVSCQVLFTYLDWLKNYCRHQNEALRTRLKDAVKVLVDLPLRLIKKPLVAALSGYAVAEGFEIALMCDLRVIEENALMGIYNRRFGISWGNGGIVHLSSIIGLSRALDLILTGRTVTAKEAFDWGLANRLVACGTALGQAIQVAGSLAKFPQKCLLQDRKTLYESAFCQSLEKLLENERNNSIKVFDEESINGAKKFVELGIGKHGKTYHLKEKVIPDWEKE